MSHWGKYQRVYTGALVFISANAAAAVVVFGSLSHAELYALGFRDVLMDLIKCAALASATLLTYVGVSPKSPPLNPPS